MIKSLNCSNELWQQMKEFEGFTSQNSIDLYFTEKQIASSEFSYEKESSWSWGVTMKCSCRPSKMTSIIQTPKNENYNMR